MTAVVRIRDIDPHVLGGALAPTGLGGVVGRGRYSCQVTLVAVTVAVSS